MHLQPSTRRTRLLPVIALFIGLTGCLGEGSGEERILGTPQPPLTGALVDSFVDGAQWETAAGETGLTNSAGEFQYMEGEVVTFSVGDILLGSATGAPLLSAVELTGSVDPTARAALNLLVFLQSIDADADPSNGITISAATRDAAAGMTLNFAAADFATRVATVVAAITQGNAVVSDSAALNHFYLTYAQAGGTNAFNFLFPGFPPVGAGANYELVFADEFNEGTMPNEDNWTIETGYGPDNFGWGNNEWQLYTTSPDNVRVEGGNLVLSAQCPTPPCGVRDDTITSGKINSLNKFNFKYGKVVARIKPPVGEAAWPAFWALGANHPTVGWPRSGEIDFMEIHNAFSNERTAHFTLHWCDDSIQAPARCSFPDGWVFDTQNRTFDTSLGDDFHIFEADWTADRIIGKVDGVTVYNRAIDAATMEEFLREFYMIFNVAMGGTLGSNNQPPNGNEVFPQTMLVDYVRVYQQVGGSTPTAFAIDFEDDAETYDFGLSGGFGGGAAAVVPNPVPGGINDSAQVARMLKFSGEVFAGSLLALPTPLDVTAGSSFTMKVWSPRAVDVLFKLEGDNEVERSVAHGGSGWEELTFDFGNFAGTATGLTFIFDLGIVGDATNDPDNWTFYFDDIELVVDDTGGGPVEFDGGFEGLESDYDFEDFGGGAAAVIPNPVSGGINTSAQVVRMFKFAGEVFAGSKLNLATPLVVEAGTSFSMKVWSPRPVMVVLKLEGAVEAEVNLAHSGSGWEELIFDYGDFAGDVVGLTVIFDLGIVGDAEGDPDNWTFYYDDITQIPPDDNGGGPGPQLAQIDLPVTFDNPTVDYTLTDFGMPAAAMTTLVADPDDSTNMVASTVKPLGAPVWAGTTIGTTAGLASAIPFTAGVTTIGIRVYSPDVGTPVRLKAEDMVDGTVSVETEVLTTVANEWETLVFDFASVVEGDPLDLAVAYRALSVFFNFGTDGDTAGQKTYLWDDVEFGVLPPVIADTTPPTLTAVSIASGNANPALATLGDVITLSLTADEPIATPTVTINGVAASVSGADTSWTASRALTAADNDGAATFSVVFADIAGNFGTPATTTSDASGIVIDATAPVLNISTLPATLTSLAPFGVTFAFSEAVSGFDLSDIVTSNASATDLMAINALTYTANITPTADGDVSVSVAAGAAADATGNVSLAGAAVTTFIDATPPMLTAVNIATDNANPAFATTGDIVTVTLTASETIATPVVTIGGLPADNVAGADAAWQATRTLTSADADGPIGFTIAFADALGNAGAPVSMSSDSSAVLLDSIAPTLTINNAPVDFTTLSPFSITLQFSEAVSGVTLSDIQTTNGAAMGLVAVDAATYTASVTPNGNGDLTIAVAAGAAFDSAGNPSEMAVGVTVLNMLDGDAPRLTTISIASDNADPTIAVIGNVVTILMTANEEIIAPTVTIGGVAADEVSGAGTSWQASRALSASDSEGPITFVIDFEDLIGNPGPTSTVTTDTSSVVFDITGPTLAINGMPATISLLDPLTLTFQFNEDVVGFDTADITVGNGSAAAVTAIDAATYTSVVTPDGNGDLTVAVAAGAAQDAAGNLSAMAAVGAVLLDVIPPELVSASIASTNANPLFARPGDDVTVSLTTNEDIVAPTVTIAGGAADTVSGAGGAWTASRTALATDTDGPVTFTIDFEDVSGNAGTQASATTDATAITFDGTAPTVSISGVNPTVGLDPITVTFQFSEDVTGFDIAGIVLVNASASEFVAIDSVNYSADITPNGNGDLTITVAADAAADVAGNGSEVASVSAIVNTSPFWEEVWSDDFAEDGNLDAQKWNVRSDVDCPAPCSGIQSYRSERVSVAGGALMLEARDDVARGGANYTSGLVDTRGHLEFKYGRVEIDARMPATLGAMPSLSMLPANDTYGAWPLSGQIDIVNAPDLDGVNQDLEHTLHYGLPQPQNTATTGIGTAPSAPEASFLTYALEWEAGEIRWFVDDVHVFTQTQDNWYTYTEDADGIYEEGTGAAPFDDTFYLVLSLAVGDNVDPGAGSSFPQVLQIDAVRVFRCVNATDPTAGTGCSTGDPGVTPLVAPGAPFTDMLEVYTDAPAVVTLDGVDNTLVAGSSGTVTVSDTAVVDGATTVWRVNADASAASGEVFMASEDLSANFAVETGFDLSGSGAAGELLFDMRVNSSTGTSALRARLDSPGGGGEVLLPMPADNLWHTYSVKIADLLANPVAGGTGLDLSNVVNVFALEVTDGNVNLDLDNIRVKVACRDSSQCQPKARVHEYSQDFESLLQTEPAALSDDGWVIFGAVFNNGNFLFGYGTFAAPNGGPAFSAIAANEGGTEQGVQQLSIYNDYDNPSHGAPTRRIESNVFRERLITQDDVGRTIWFSFDTKLGNLEGASTANAFIKTIDPNANFAQTNLITFDTTTAPLVWNRHTISLPDVAPELVGQFLQIGFSSTAGNFEGSGVFYDNIQVGYYAPPAP